MVTFLTEGDDYFRGEPGVGGEVAGLGGNDTMTGNWGTQIMYGDAGNDKLYGDGGNPDYGYWQEIPYVIDPLTGRGG